MNFDDEDDDGVGKIVINVIFGFCFFSFLIGNL